MASEEDIERLQLAIHRLHGCDSRHAETVRVHESFQGKTVWEGEVEVFDVVNGHARAKKVYSWLYEESGVAKAAAILGLRPVNSASDAVKAYIISEARKKTG